MKTRLLIAIFLIISGATIIGINSIFLGMRMLLWIGIISVVTSIMFVVEAIEKRSKL